VRIGSWSVRSFYRSESLNIVAKKLLKAILDLVGVLEVGWDKEALEEQRSLLCLMEKEMKVIN